MWAGNWLIFISPAFYWSKQDRNLTDIQEVTNRLHLLMEGYDDIGKGEEIQPFCAINLPKQSKIQAIVFLKCKKRGIKLNQKPQSQVNSPLGSLPVSSTYVKHTPSL